MNTITRFAKYKLHPFLHVVGFPSIGRPHVDVHSQII